MSGEGAIIPAQALPSTVDEIKLPTSPHEGVMVGVDVLDDFFGVQRHGPANGWTICAGVECPYSRKCPLLKNSLPVPDEGNDDCPVEIRLVRTWIGDLLAELGVTGHHQSSVIGRVKDFANFQLEEYRVQIFIALAGAEGYVLDSFRFMTPMGDVINEPKLNQLHSKLEKLQKQKSAILKELMATPEQKAKDKNRQAATVVDLLALMNAKGHLVLGEHPRPDYAEIDREKSGQLLIEEEIAGTAEAPEGPGPAPIDLDNLETP